MHNFLKIFLCLVGVAVFGAPASAQQDYNSLIQQKVGTVTRNSDGSLSVNKTVTDQSGNPVVNKNVTIDYGAGATANTGASANTNANANAGTSASGTAQTPGHTIQLEKSVAPPAVPQAVNPSLPQPTAVPPSAPATAPAPQAAEAPAPQAAEAPAAPATTAAPSPAPAPAADVPPVAMNADGSLSISEAAFDLYAGTDADLQKIKPVLQRNPDGTLLIPKALVDQYGLLAQFGGGAVVEKSVEINNGGSTIKATKTIQAQ